MTIVRLDLLQAQMIKKVLIAAMNLIQEVVKLQEQIDITTLEENFPILTMQHVGLILAYS